MSWIIKWRSPGKAVPLYLYKDGKRRAWLPPDGDGLRIWKTKAGAGRYAQAKLNVFAGGEPAEAVEFKPLQPGE